MSRLFPSMLVPLAALVLAIAAHGQSEPPAEAASSADAAAPATSAASMPSHGAAAHVEAVRHAHLRRLQERLDTPEEELHRTCRFESDIATLPPQGVVALTFDDGPEPGHTEEILAILERHQVPATFFLIAEKAHAHPELVARMKALPGAVLGNHSWSHPNFHDIPVDEQREQIVHADAQLRPELAAAPVFRYPYGNSSCEGNDQVHALGYRIVGWHVDSCDWAFDGPEGLTAREALSCGVLPAFRRDYLGHVLSGVRAHRGGIVLMHETQHITVDNLDALITRLQAEGYRFATPAAEEFTASLR